MKSSGPPVMGVCRFCGCTEDNACRMPDNEGCSWVDPLRTVCSNWRCLAAWSSERRRVERARKRELAEMRRQYWERHRAQKQRQAAKPAKRRSKPKGRAA